MNSREATNTSGGSLTSARGHQNTSGGGHTHKPHTDKDMGRPRTWEALLRVLQGKKAHVRGSGTCWIFSLLAAFGICDHAFSTEDKHKKNKRATATPSVDDQTRQSVLRTIIADTMLVQGATAEAVSHVRQCCAYESGHAADRLSTGGYGSEKELKMVAKLLQTSIVCIDAKWRNTI